MAHCDKLAMRKLIALFLSLLAIAAQPAFAGEVVTETVEETVFVSNGGSERFVASAPPVIPQGIARFGPFRVLDATRVALVDVTDARSPAQFTALLKAFPGVSAPYEAPTDADLVLATDRLSPAECVAQVLALLRTHKLA